MGSVIDSKLMLNEASSICISIKKMCHDFFRWKLITAILVFRSKYHINCKNIGAIHLNSGLVHSTINVDNTILKCKTITRLENKIKWFSSI